jgi:hypothetical protein
VTIETEENIVLRTTTGQNPSTAWCPSCRRHVTMVTPEDAAQIADVSPRTIYACVESRKIHFAQIPGGLLLVCLDSLAGVKANPTTATGPDDRSS